MTITKRRQQTAWCWLTALTLTTVMTTLGQAAVITWNGAHANGDWTNGGVGGNWSDAAAPVSDTTNELVFDENQQGQVSNNDNGGNFQLKSMTFNNGLPTFTVAGGTLELTNTPSLTVDSDNAVTINSGLRVAQTLTLDGTGTGTLTLGGTVRLLQTAAINPISLNFTGDRDAEMSGQFFGVTELGATTQSSIVSNNLNAGRTLTLSGDIFLKDTNSNNSRHMTLSGTGDTLITGEIRGRLDGSPNGSRLTITNTGTTTITGDNPGLNGVTLTGSGAIETSGDRPLGDTVILSVNSTKTVELLADTTMGSINASGGTTLAISGGYDMTVEGDVLGVSLGGSNPTNVTFQFDNQLTTVAGTFGINVSGGNRTLNLTGSGRLEVDGEIPTLSSNAHSLTFNVNGTGTVALNNGNNFNGAINNPVIMNVNSGVLEIGADALSSGGALGSNTTVNLGNTSGSANAALLIAGDFEVGRDITVRSGSSGTAALGSSGVSNASFTGDITLNKSVRLTADTDGTTVFDGNLGGSGGVNVIGTGVVELAGTNTYGGATSVDTGTLLVSGSITSGTTVQAAGTLGGGGLIGGASTVHGTLRPGSSAGLLSFGSSLDLQNTATTFMEIGAPTTRGGTYDAIDVVTSLTYDGVLSLEIGQPHLTGEWDLFNFATQTGSFDSVTLSGFTTGDLLLSDDLWSGQFGFHIWSFDQTSGILSSVSIPVPEPSGFALLFSGVMFLYQQRRKRTRR